MRVVRFGDEALLVSTPALAPRIVREALAQVPGVRDVVVTAELTCVHVDVRRSLRAWRQLIAAALSRARTTPATRRRRLRIDLCFDGPDLDEVAGLTGRSRDAVIAGLVERPLRVEMIGFLPGFAYLAGLDVALHTPRRARPRTRVEAGAFAIAGPYAGIYPLPSPGGWNLVGTARSFRPFDPRRGAVLDLGDEVVLRAVTR